MSKENTAEAASLEDMFDLDDVQADEVNEEVDEVEQEAPPEVEQPVEEPDLIDPPEFFSKEDKEYFQKLQQLEGGRDYAERWHNQYNEHQKYINTKQQEIAERKRDLETYQRWNQAISPLSQIWQQQAIDPAIGLAQLAHYGQMLHQDPQGLIQDIAKRTGVDLSQMLEEQPYIDPVVDTKLRTLEQQLQQSQQVIGQFQQAQQNQSAQAIQSQILDFKDAKDGNGEPLHPYFDRVKEQMQYLLQTPNNGITDLNSAYESAIKYTPEIQQEIQDKQVKSEATKRQAEASRAKEASTKVNSKSKDAPKTKKTLENLFDGVLDDD